MEVVKLIYILMMTRYCVRQVGLQVKQPNGIVELKMENRYLQELTFTKLWLEIIQKHGRW